LNVDIWLKLAAFVLLLAAAAFFSSLESAYFSLSRATLDRLRNSSDPRARRAARLMSDPRRLLTTILTGNTLVITIAAALAALVAIDIALTAGVNPTLAVALEVVIVTVVILVFSELTPKLFALRKAESWAVRSSALAMGFWYLLYPLAKPLAGLSSLLSRLLGIERQTTLMMTEGEIRSLIELGHERGELEQEERRLIHSIVEFGDTIAREVMIPRMDVVTADKNAPLDELLKIIVTHGHSRIPVTDGSVDNIIGLIHGKDLLKVVQAPDEYDLMKILRPITFVPEEKKIDDLLREFQSAKVHMAVVVDEYGGTAGLVTLEDIIEEIFGEIQDEYDREQPLLKRLDERSVVANALIGTSDLNQELGEELIQESDAYDTLGGFAFSQLGIVPHKGEEFEFQGYRFIVEEVHGKRITRVKITKEKGALEGA
jgi:CBS domain containing-hemolysin-like protein